MTTAAELIERTKAEEIRFVDVRATDLLGRWRQVSLDTADLTAEAFERGVMADGSSIPGWRDVAESDLVLLPAPETAYADPFAAQPTLAVIATATEPGTGVGYERDPRSSALAAEARLEALCGADAVRIGLDVNFFLFDDVRIEQGPMRGGFTLEASESRTAGGRAYANGNPGHRPTLGGAHLACAPADHGGDIRAEIVTVLRHIGFDNLRHEHAGTACQGRLTFGPGSLVDTADRMQILRHTVHGVAASYGRSATFMAKPLLEEPGAALNASFALWAGDRPLFAGQGYADLSPMALHFIAGILAHGRALCAFTNPTANSYKRLQPGSDEPNLLAYAAHNRSAAVRIPYADQAAAKRVEVRFPDPTANPYLAFTALLLAGIDGIEKKLEPGDAMDRNLYDLRPDEVEGIPTLCRDLNQALDTLESESDFLTRDEIVPSALIEAYLDVKRRELDFIARRPTPVEFELYYGI